MGNPNFRKMYNNFRRKKKQKKVKTKTNNALTRQVQKINKRINTLNKKSEPLYIKVLGNEVEYLNAESEVKVYNVTRDNRFTSKSVAASPYGGVIPQNAYRKGDELYLSKIDFYLQLVNRQSIYKTRLMVIQFRDFRDISRAIDPQGAADYNPNILMHSNLAKWNIVGSQTIDDLVGGPKYGSKVNYAGLMMKQPVKDVKDRYDSFHVLHDEVISNPEQDNIPGQKIENETDCIKRSVYVKLKQLNFQHPYDNSPLNDIIAIVFNSYPENGKWQDPDLAVVGDRGHCLNWTYNIYDN